jgi:transposase-like protein
MQCPRCASTHIRKNGRKYGKQNHICVPCGRQFIDSYEHQGYSAEVYNPTVALTRFDFSKFGKYRTRTSFSRQRSRITNQS